MKAGLWYLYANDQELAIHLLNRTIRGANQNDEKHALISLLTYIGDYKGCSNWLDEINGEQEIVGRQSRYRILRSIKIRPEPLEGTHRERRHGVITQHFRCLL